MALRAPSAVSRASAAVSALAGVRPCPASRSGAGISQQLLRPCNPLSSRVQPSARRSHGTASRSIVRAQANGSGLMIDLTGARDWTVNTPDQDAQGVATRNTFQILVPANSRPRSYAMSAGVQRACRRARFGPIVKTAAGCTSEACACLRAGKKAFIAGVADDQVSGPAYSTWRMHADSVKRGIISDCMLQRFRYITLE